MEKKTDTKEIELTTRAIVTSDLFSIIDASAAAKNISFESAFADWKRDFIANPASVENRFLRVTGIKHIDKITPEMVIKEHRAIVSGKTPDVSAVLLAETAIEHSPTYF